MSREVQVEGYAVTFGTYPVMGGPACGDGWMERITRDALEQAVAGNPDIKLTAGGKTVASTGDGTLTLSVDDTGLKVNATIQVGHRFRVKDQEWATDARSGTHYGERLIKALTLDTLEISPNPWV